jgi:cytochrome oxidase Cu insertion factor (SCO1/SenC/PrrC family)
MKSGSIYKTSKHIFLRKETKDRLGSYIQKGETWDFGISDILDFLKVEEIQNEFMLFKINRKNDNSKH